MNPRMARSLPRRRPGETCNTRVRVVELRCVGPRPGPLFYGGVSLHVSIGHAGEGWGVPTPMRPASAAPATTSARTRLLRPDSAPAERAPEAAPAVPAVTAPAGDNKQQQQQQQWRRPPPPPPPPLSNLALIWEPDSTVHKAIGALLMQCTPPLTMLVISSEEEVKMYVDSNRASVLFAGTSSVLVGRATSALLACEQLCPLVRLLRASDLEPQQAAVRLDAKLSAAHLADAIAKARELLFDGLGGQGREQKAAARRRLAHWTAKGASASAVTPARHGGRFGTLIDQARSNAEGEGGGGGGGCGGDGGGGCCGDGGGGTSGTLSGGAAAILALTAPAAHRVAPPTPTPTPPAPTPPLLQTPSAAHAALLQTPSAAHAAATAMKPRRPSSPTSAIPHARTPSPPASPETVTADLAHTAPPVARPAARPSPRHASLPLLAAAAAAGRAESFGSEPGGLRRQVWGEVAAPRRATTVSICVMTAPAVRSTCAHAPRSTSLRARSCSRRLPTAACRCRAPDGLERVPLRWLAGSNSIQRASGSTCG